MTGEQIVALEHGTLSIERQVGARPEGHHAYVSIMRGCDNFCSYCIVPLVRGRERSREADEVMEEVNQLVADGVREVTLLGQNVNSYGKHLPQPQNSLPRLLERLDALEGLWRVRFVTNHPADMTEDILQAVAELDSVCEHLHMPAQSGSTDVLRRMGRGYTEEDYRNLVARTRDMVPGVAVASDFMVGFPGESDDDFRDTLRMVRELEFQQCYMFKYSPRPGTRAAKWDDDVPEETKKARHQELLSAQDEVDTRRRSQMVGERVRVLVNGVSKKDEGKLSGRTRQNDIVAFEGPEELAGQLCDVKITDYTTLTLFGEPVNL
jgi:tRNA-2-methylthio-N6-dimethylallyladenosine synthase